MMDRRENTLALLAHEQHDHVPNYFTDVCGTGANLLTFDNGPFGGGPDGFGVVWTTSASAMGGALPVQGKYVLDDICDWKEVVKFPDVTKFDWEGLAAQQLAMYNPHTQIQEFSMWNGPFLRMTHLMGFENGLCAMYEEPDASFELLNAIADYRIQIAEHAVRYFKPDSICEFDDFATERGPFVSPEIYQKLIKPVHKRLNDAISSMGVIPNMHVCGKCDVIVPDFVDEGIAAWEVCQPENDLVGLGGKLGGKLAFIGGYDMKGRFAYAEYTEEELRASVRDTIDKYAPAGNYAFFGMLMTTDINKVMASSGIMSDEAVKYGENYYLK